MDKEIEKSKKSKKHYRNYLIFKSFFLLKAFKNIKDERNGKFVYFIRKSSLANKRKIFNILAINMSTLK